MRNDENLRLEQGRRILFILKQFKRKYKLTIQNLTEIMEEDYSDVSRRSIQRDLKILSEEGFIIKLSKGRNTTWSIAKNETTSLLPFQIKSSEMLSFYVLKSFIKSFQGTSIEAEINNLEKKLEELAPDEVIQEESFIWDNNPGYYDYSRKNNTINTIVKSIVEKSIIQFDYEKMSSGLNKEHEVLPQSLLFYNGNIYLIGFHLIRKKQFTYAIQNINNIRVTDMNSYGLPKYNRFEFEKNIFSIFENKNVKQVKIKINKDFEKYFENRYWHSSAYFSRDDKGSLILEMTIPITPDVVSWICSWREEVVVIEPEELKKEIVKSLNKSLKRYEI